MIPTTTHNRWRPVDSFVAEIQGLCQGLRIITGAPTHNQWRSGLELRINGGAFTHNRWRLILTEHFRTFFQNILQNFQKKGSRKKNLEKFPIQRNHL